MFFVKIFALVHGIILFHPAGAKTTLKESEIPPSLWLRLQKLAQPLTQDNFQLLMAFTTEIYQERKLLESLDRQIQERKKSGENLKTRDYKLREETSMNKNKKKRKKRDKNSLFFTLDQLEVCFSSSTNTNTTNNNNNNNNKGV